MTPIAWRTATATDADSLAQLGAATFLTAFAFDHPGPALISFLKTEHAPQYYAEKLNDPDTDILIGETPLGAPVGYAMLCPPAHPKVQIAGDHELKRIYILGPWQGGGNGSALMDLVIAAAAARGASRLLLAVYEQNDRAQRFYENAGFAQVGEAIFMVGDVAFRDLVYAKTL